MSTNSKLLAVLFGSVSAMALASSSAEAGGGGGIDAPFPGTLSPITLSCLNRTNVAAATLTPPLGQPAATQVDGLTQANVFCQNTIQIPGSHRLTSFDISWVDPVKALYFLADRSNAGIDVINTANNTFHARLGAGFFAGIHFANPTSIDNNVSGPNGVVSNGNWVYAGDGDSTLKVFNIAHMKSWPGVNAPVQTISTGGATRLDEMEIDPVDCILIAANNAEDPPYATLFAAQCGNTVGGVVTPIAQVFGDATLIPPGAGLSLEQPRWDSLSGRFVTGVPLINDPQNLGCNYGQNTGTIAPTNGPTQVIGAAAKTANLTCDGALLVINPTALVSTGVVPANTVSIGVPQFAFGIWSPALSVGVIPLTNYALTANASVNAGSAINVAPNVPTVNVFSTSALVPETLSPYANPGLYWVKQSTTVGPAGLAGTGSQALTYTGCSPNGVAFNPVSGDFLLACNQGNQAWNVATQVVSPADGSGVGISGVGPLPLIPVGKNGCGGNPLTPPGCLTSTGILLPNLTPAANTFTVPGVVGGDETWFNGAIIKGTAFGDGNYYIAASKGGSFRSDANFTGTVPAGTLNLTQPPLNFAGTCTTTCGPVLGIVAGFQYFDPIYNFVTYPVIGTIGESNGSHSVAADAIRNQIYVPNTAPMLLRAGGNPNLPIDLNAIGGDTTGNRQNTSNSFLNCGGVLTANARGVVTNAGNGCIVVYKSVPGGHGGGQAGN